MRKATLLQLVGAVLLAVSAAVAPAQDSYPSRAIRIVVPVPPGSSADALPRIVAEKLAVRWGRPVIIENRPGGALNIAAEAAAKAEPDGHTLLATPSASLVINQYLYPKLGFDPGAFVPVTVMATTPNVLVAYPKVPFSTVQGLVAFAKAHPGKLAYASGGLGSTQHLAMELLKLQAGIEIVHVPYKGLVMTDLLAGRVDVMFNNLGNTLPQIESGALKLLAVGSEKRLAAMPDVPAVAETFPGFASTAWFGVVAPPKTSPAIAGRLSVEIAEILRLPDVARRFQELSMTPVGSTPAETAAFIREDRERWRRVIVTARIKSE